jgi:hypothetical protein
MPQQSTAAINAMSNLMAGTGGTQPPHRVDYMSLSNDQITVLIGRMQTPELERKSEEVKANLTGLEGQLSEQRQKQPQNVVLQQELVTRIQRLRNVAAVLLRVLSLRRQGVAKYVFSLLSLEKRI